MLLEKYDVISEYLKNGDLQVEYLRGIPTKTKSTNTPTNKQTDRQIYEEAYSEMGKQTKSKPYIPSEN